MHPNLFYLIITVITAFIIAIPPCYSQGNNHYGTCDRLSNYRCANIDYLWYPFWGGSKPDYCGGGHSAFQLINCQGDIALIIIGSITYRVISMNEFSRTLTLARDDLVDDNCPSVFINTTFDSNLFRPFSPFTNRDVALYYGCTSIPGQVTPSPNQFNCSVNGDQTVSYFRMEVGQNRIGENLMACTNNITVPINERSSQVLVRAEASVADLQVALASGFEVGWTANATLCNDCERSRGRCGTVTGSNSFTCFCSDGVFDTRCPNGSSSTGSRLNVTLVIGFSVSGSAVSVVILMTILYYRKRRPFMAKKNKQMFDKNVMAKKNKQMFDKNVEAFLTNHGSLAPKRYSYSNIKKITNSFADKLGEGGFGSVFKGKLLDGRFVAVKVLTDANGDGGNFVNEVASISITSHVNIVTLLGFCLERNNRALVYEFMPNKSLDKFIHKSESSFSLDLETLYKVAVGTARGLEYLHRGCNTRIVHFDIKPENILLDEEFCPKISDFGLAKLCQTKISVVSMIGARGTPGYIAPEVFSRSFGEVSHKSDVYSYGMMVINMIGVGEKKDLGLDSTKSEMYFPDIIYKRLELMSEDVEEETSKKMVLVSLWCIQTNPLDRPSMGKVVEMLEGNIELIQIPPKPFLFSHTRVNQDSCSPSSSSYEIELMVT